MKRKVVTYRERIYRCGFFTEVEIFPVYRKAGARRSKAKPTSETQTRLNDKKSRQHFIRLLHNNFTQGDHVIGLDYADSCLPNDDDAAKRDVQNFLRRLRRLYSKSAAELKYIMVYERSERGRPHFHLTVNRAGAVPASEIRKLWRYGRTEIDPLQLDENGAVGWSKYVSKNNLFGKRWCASRNLKQPRPVDRDYTLTQKKVEAFRREDAEAIHAAYGDGNIIDVHVENNDVNRADYISITMFDYSGVCAQLGVKRYERKVRKRE